MGPQVQPKCFRHLQHMRNNWELRKRGYLIRFGHTEALLLKKMTLNGHFLRPAEIDPYMNDANHFVTNKLTDKGLLGLGCVVVQCIISNLSFISRCKNIWLCNYGCINASFPAQNRLSNTRTYQNTISSRWIFLALSWYQVEYITCAEIGLLFVFQIQKLT